MGVGSQRRSSALYPQEKDPVPIVQALLRSTFQMVSYVSQWLHSGIKAQDKLGHR